MYRIGFGYDAHRLVTGRPLVLGGVHIPGEMGLLGHSDADVLSHAVIDAILGALGKDDIGHHFPDSDPAYKDQNSLVLLRQVMSMAKDNGFRINNADATVVAQKPKLAPFIPQMKERLSDVMETRTNQINIKATTTEGMGFCGRGEGIAAYAVVSLIQGNTT